jgi:CAAX prenyl protease-like protein
MIKKLLTEYPMLRFAAPFLAFILMLGLKGVLPISARLQYPTQVALVSAVLLVVSRPLLYVKLARPAVSTLVGLLVFVIWIGPDRVWPGYRHLPIFENPVTGSAVGSLPIALTSDSLFLAFRIFGTIVLVPIIEELFWRGWLMRYLINADFQKVPLGSYSASAFWITAALFATEHGPYWEVGLIAGVIYNWWMLRTRNLMDCMLAHAVTNACLALYVVGLGHWEYWL